MTTLTIEEAQKAFTKTLTDMGLGAATGNGNGNGHASEHSQIISVPGGSDVDEPIMLQSKDLESPGPEMEVGQDCTVDISEMGLLERIISPHNNLMPVHFLEEGAIKQRAVARVAIPGVGYGTGFLVSNSLFITNNHVIGTVTEANNAKFEFNYQEDFSGNAASIDTFRANPASVFYTNAALDFTLVRLRSKSIFSLNAPGPFVVQPSINPGAGTPIINPSRIDPFPVGPLNRFFIAPGTRWGYLPLINSNYARDQHVNIIQHPRARRKEVALQDNHITQVFTTRVRYTTDTEPGSSGSPVFNNAWDLVALHHAAGARNSSNQWISNQGIRIDKIITDIRNHFTNRPGGAQILNELGI